MGSLSGFVGTRGVLDRVAKQRRDAAWVAARLEEDASRILVTSESRILVRRGDEGLAPALLTPAEAGPLLELGEAPVLLGCGPAGARFALELPAAVLDAATLPRGTRAHPLRGLLGTLAADEAELVFHAEALARWHRAHRFCGRCGASTASLEAGTLRRCTSESCASDHFPRVDPAIIVLVSMGEGADERALLGRQASWPDGLYSTLAGFVEPGESLESALAREVEEEAGVRVDPESVEYRASQPWPFPSSLMLGFRARTEDRALVVDGEELEDAQWFSREALREERGVRLPSVGSIARALIIEWLEESDRERLPNIS